MKRNQISKSMLFPISIFMFFIFDCVLNCVIASEQKKSASDQYVKVKINCVLYHKGYKGVVVAPGISKPTEGTALSLECKGVIIELTKQTIINGFIETKDFGKIGIRLSSMVSTLGAGDGISVVEGAAPVPSQVVELYLHKSREKEFLKKFSN